MCLEVYLQLFDMVFVRFVENDVKDLGVYIKIVFKLYKDIFLISIIRNEQGRQYNRKSIVLRYEIKVEFWFSL